MGSSTLDKLLQDIKEVMRAKDQEKLLALRTLHAEIKNKAINERKELTDEDVAEVVVKAIKQRQEAAELYRQGGREDLAAREEAQIALYRRYQPEQMGREEIEALVDRLIQETGASSKRDMGKLMKALMPLVRGKADGKMVNEIVAARLV